MQIIGTASCILCSGAPLFDLGNHILIIGIISLLISSIIVIISRFIYIHESKAMAIIFTIIINVLIHLVTLDVEIDASFNRALPILREKVPSQYHEKCRSVLRAAAYTYVIGALRSVISLRYIWLLIMRLR